ncbi:MAG: 4'-phosphopantetheinyl transferase superfamily protein [Bacilli bacterium]|nr:4'-phosphopantetheinyl transferase superfamily protein [Bacilli bacterium]
MQTVKLYVADTELGKKHFRFLLENVSIGQKEKALRYANEIDQIRSLLSSYLKNQLSREELLKNENGKPYFANGPYFNISHSGKYVLMVVSTAEIGVDIEEIKSKDMSSLVRIFNEAEAKMIKEHSDFYYLWCAKESLIKCMGLTVGKVREIPGLPLNGLKTFKGKDYQCKSFIYDKHIVSITREGNEEYEIDIKKVNKLPYLMK